MVRPPNKPTKPKKPKLTEPVRDIIDRFYLYQVTIYRNNETNTSEEIVFVKDNELPYCDEGDDPCYEYYKIEGIKLPVLLALLEEKGIDPENVMSNNERYYRKSDGQVVLSVSRSLSDEDYQNWVDDNQAQLDQHLLEHKALR